MEITRLLAAGFIKEVYHLEWLANPVLVRKKNKEWRMCVNYTDLNRRLRTALFLDYYSGYHQISLKEEDQIKTSFIMPFGAYCYITMSFGLKNARATYQRAIQMCLDQ